MYSCVTSLYLSWRTLQQLHNPVKQAVDDLKARGLVVEHSGQSPLVPGTDLGPAVLEDDV